jgi:hypothetical protein
MLYKICVWNKIVFKVSSIRDIINDEIYKKINIMYIIVLFLPLLSFFFVGLFGKYFGRILFFLIKKSDVKEHNKYK